MRNLSEVGGRADRSTADVPEERTFTFIFSNTITINCFQGWEDEDIRMILKAEECFRYQLVFNTKTKNIEPLGRSLKYHQIWLILYGF